MNSAGQQRLWLMIGFIVILIFMFMFMSDAPSTRDSDPWDEEYAVERVEGPTEISIIHIALGVALVGVILLTFHPFYGGLTIKQRFFYQLGIVALASLLAGLLKYFSLTITILTVGFFFCILYLIAIPFLISNKYYRLVHAILDLAQRIAPKNANLWITRAWTYGAQGEFEKTIQAANQAIEFTPRLKKKEEEGWFHLTDSRLSGAHQVRMQTYFALAQHELALEDAEILVRLEPTLAIHYANRSMALRKRGDFAAADADLDTAAQLNPDDFQKAYLIYSRADLLSLQDRTQEAIELSKTAFIIPVPEQQKKWLYPEIYSQIGRLEMRLGNDAAAEEAFKMAQTIDPEFMPVALVALYARQGRWKEAIELWQQLTRKAPVFARMDITRRHFYNDLYIVDLIEQVIARSNPTVSNTEQARPLSAS